MINSRTRIFVISVVLCLTQQVALAQSATTLATDLTAPVKIVFTDDGTLIVAESGNGANNGRVSLVDRCGTRRSLLSGLPSGISSMGDPSGPGGIARDGVVLYIAIGAGDAVRLGTPGTEIPNPQGPSSPLLSSVLVAEFSADIDLIRSGFTLTVADHTTMKAGTSVVKTNTEGFTATFRLLADFPDYIPDPIANVRPSNPFALALSGGRLYVADASFNAIRRVNTATGAFDTLAIFPPQPNPLPFGPPVFEAVPNGLYLAGDQLLVTFLTGFPFPAGRADVRSVNLANGMFGTLIGGLTTAIDVLTATSFFGSSSYFVLEFSTNFLADAPGRVLQFKDATGPGTVVAGGLESPTGMARDSVTGDLFISEFFPGRVAQIAGGELDVVLRDDETGDVLRFNRHTGDYVYASCRTGAFFSGKGRTQFLGCRIVLLSARATAVFNSCTDSGSARIFRSSFGSPSSLINDSDTTNSDPLP